MDITIQPGKLSGAINAIPSKSQAHRLLICAAFSHTETTLLCPATNQDIEATANCLNSLGANIQRTPDGYRVIPVADIPEGACLDCRESGSTLRFLLPIAAALGVDTTFVMSGGLPSRPLSPLWEELERMGCQLSRPTANTVRCHGQLKSGEFFISGGVSSQFITGLLFAGALIPGENKINIIGKLESAPYVEMTRQAMSLFGVESPDLTVQGGRRFCSPGTVNVEGDWSNGAFWLAAKALGSPLEIRNLSPNSPQGDRAVVDYLQALNTHAVIDATDTPDLIPILAVVAGARHGAVFNNCGRLRLKETDRLQTTAAMLTALGGKAQIQGDCLTVFPTGYCGGTVDATNDHRIAMSAAIAATVCTEAVTVHNAQAVEKSYPAFWQDYEMLGGKL